MLSISVLLILSLCSCVSKKEMKDISCQASKDALRDLLELQNNHYEIYGVVREIKKKEQLIGTGAIPYQYKIEIEPVGYYDKSDEKRFFHITFISPLKNDGAKPKFKIGDRIKIKGWIESF